MIASHQHDFGSSQLVLSETIPGKKEQCGLGIIALCTWMHPSWLGG